MVVCRAAAALKSSHNELTTAPCINMHSKPSKASCAGQAVLAKLKDAYLWCGNPACRPQQQLNC